MARHLCCGIYVPTWERDGEDEAPLPKKPKAVGRCHYCDRRVYRAFNGEVDDEGSIATRDHKVPASRGGEITVLACRRCNNVRGDAPYELFAHWSTYMNTATDEGLMRKAFKEWMHSLAVEEFRRQFSRHEAFVEPWKPAAIIYEAPKSTGRYGRRALRHPLQRT